MEERIQKIISRAGLASRRKAERLILEGRVMVNGQKVLKLGTKADINRDHIEVNGKPILSYPHLVYFLFYKPRNVVSSLYDPNGRKTIESIIRGKIETRVFPVGRLDYDAEGAILLTNDGELAHYLLHPKYSIPRTYLVKVKGIPGESEVARLKKGISIEKGITAKAVDAKIVRSLRSNCWIEIVLNEGKNREIKRLCEEIGHPVLRILRTKFAFLDIKGLMPGDLRPLSKREVFMLKKLHSGKIHFGKNHLHKQRNIRR
jgi:pseudouridine synthase